jgi:hypothetical protein
MTAATRRRLTAGAVAICLTTVVLGAQRFGAQSRRADLGVEVQGNTEYDGRFVFARISYPTSGRYRHVGNGGYPWSHDYPDGEVHFSKILDELTLLNIRTDGSNIIGLDDPELMNYPVAYMAEPGFWFPTDREAAAFSQYLRKGGFAIFDDFRGEDWYNLQVQMTKVLPDLRWIELTGSEPVFHSFFEIPDPLAMPSAYRGLQPSYWGIFEGNDQNRRMLAIANPNQDLSEYWEYSGSGYYIVDISNEAYKFGVNYVMYGLTH